MGTTAQGRQLTVTKDILPIAAGIAQQESGQRYNAIGPQLPAGDRPLGKYQIRSSQIAQWSKDVLGFPITPAQFMSSPKLQDIIALSKMQQYYTKYGTAADVASMWYSGRPARGNNSYDSTSGQAVPQYVKAVLGHISRITQQYNEPTVAGVRD